MGEIKGMAMPSARAGVLRAEPQDASQAKPLIAIAQRVPEAALGLSVPALEALLAIGTRAVTAHELGVNGLVLKRLSELGLLEADRDGLPPIYRINGCGMEIVDYLTSDFIPMSRPDEQPVARIQRQVSEYFHIPKMEMVSQRRARRIARPRQVAMYLARELTPMSLPSIGRLFGGRDHTTVMHAISVVEREIAADPQMRADVATVREAIEL